MSYWREINKKNIDDIDILNDEEEIAFYSGSDDQGNRYVYMKIDLLLKFLKDKKII